MDAGKIIYFIVQFALSYTEDMEYLLFNCNEH